MINQRVFNGTIGNPSTGIGGPDAIETDIDNLLANDQELLGITNEHETQINNLVPKTDFNNYKNNTTYGNMRKEKIYTTTSFNITLVNSGINRRAVIELTILEQVGTGIYTSGSISKYVIDLHLNWTNDKITIVGLTKIYGADKTISATSEGNVLTINITTERSIYSHVNVLGMRDVENSIIFG